MTFRRTFRVIQCREDADGKHAITIVSFPGPGRFESGQRATFYVTADEYRTLQEGSDLILHAGPEHGDAFHREGSVRSRGAHAAGRAVHVGILGGDFHFDVDQRAYDELTPGSAVVIEGGWPTSKSFAGGIAEGGIRPDEQEAVAPGTDKVLWRFNLTLTDAASVPFQQLVRLGALVTNVGGWCTQEHDRNDVSTMMFRGAGRVPPPELLQWCSDNGVACAVHADA